MRVPNEFTADFIIIWSVPTISFDFNQKFNQLSKKYREKKSHIDDTNQTITFDSILNEIILSQLATSKNVISIGGGKEALVLVGEYNNKPICIKAFRPYSASNVKRTKQQYHVTTIGMANLMAKTEYQNLRILKHFGVSVPKPLDYRNNLAFSMELVPYGVESTIEPAPLLRELNLSNYLDPGDFLEDTLDQIEKMFKEALMVHGDLSEYNILVKSADNTLVPVIIDVSQSRLYNNKTFTTTPVRIRIDEAVNVALRDVQKVLNHFQTKYKIYFSAEDVFEKLFSDLPAFAKERNILDQENLNQQKPSKTAWMNSSEIDQFTNRKMSGKDKKMQRIFNSLN